MGDTMDILFILLLIFFVTVLYVLPAIILIGVFALIINFIMSKFKDIGEPHDLDDDDPRCFICGDTEEWCKHVP
jgi:hypothetical protein